MKTMWAPARRTEFLGQIPLVTGPASTPAYAYPPAGYFANPSGAPLMSEELTSPEESHIGREFHCYKAPDGSYVSVPFGQADAYKAAGYEAVDYSNCGSPPLHAQPVGASSFLMGQASTPRVSGLGVLILGLALIAGFQLGKKYK